MSHHHYKDLRPIQEVDDLIEHFLEHGKPTVEAFGRALMWVGRNGGPALLFGLWAEGLLTRRACREHVGAVWSACEFPERAAPEDLWLRAFRRAGYTVDGRHAERPDTPLVLYRGATFERRYGMSWTEDVDRARWFASQWLANEFRPALVWTATVEPRRLLAHNVEYRPNEKEYVINTHGLAVSEYVPVDTVR